MNEMLKIFLIVAFFLYGIPLWSLRYQFRSTVYKEKSWLINIRPWFWKEIVALFSNRYFHTEEEFRIGKKYRVYLFFHLLLLTMILFF